MRQRRMRGFSLIEMMSVLGIVIIVSSISVMTLQPELKASRVTNAYNTSLMVFRQARDLAVAQRQVYYVNIQHNTTPPDTMQIVQGATGTVVNTFQMPEDLGYIIVSGIPTGAANAPDGFGAGAVAIDFDQGVSGGNKTVVYFQPDGSAQDVNGNINNGVLYVARTNDVYSSHAITIWGATGRLRGWRLVNNVGTPYWRQM